MSQILVVDDEPEMTDLLARGLGRDGHSVEAAHDGIDAMGLAREHTFDVAIVDVMLPGMSGFELTAWLKRFHPELVVILLTARRAVDDRIRGLDAGADDYVSKPFDVAELLARIRAIHRRDNRFGPRELTHGSLILHLGSRSASVDGVELRLSRTEFDVLRCLMERDGELTSRDLILAEVWAGGEFVDPNVVDQYIAALRRKLRSVGLAGTIRTVRGRGFELA